MTDSGTPPGAGNSSSLLFLSVHRPEADEEGFQDGEILTVAPAADAEPGDLVVWWRGSFQEQGLARVQDDLSLRGVAGFPGPCGDRRLRRAVIRGVVVGRLHRGLQP